MKLLLAAMGFLLGAVATSAVSDAASSTPRKDAGPGRVFTRNLGGNLVYVRVHNLPADLPTNDSMLQQPCVLDIRYVQGGAPAAAALTAWIKFHATRRTPVFVLANADTDSALVTPLVTRRGNDSVLVIGGATSTFTPDIAVLTSADAERQAYDALENGAELSSLITENAEKLRNDEASLAHERVSEQALGETVNARNAPTIDAALQRAVHLHHALVALRRL